MADHAPTTSKLMLQLLLMISLLTLALIGLGTFISSSGYGLAIPEWPLSQGRLVPPQLVGGIWYEFLHRMTAASVGLLTLIAGGLVVTRDPRPEVRRLAWTGMLLILSQIILGGAGVLLEFPAWLQVLHAFLAPVFFGLIVVLTTVFSWEWQEKRGSGVQFDADAFRKTRALALMLLIQILLGAVLANVQAGLYYTVLALHVFAALGVILSGLGAAVSVLRQFRRGPVGVAAWSLIPMLLLQLAIGLAVLMMAPAADHGQPQTPAVLVAHTVAHALLAAALLGCSAYLGMMVRRKTALARPRRVVQVDAPPLVELE